MPAHPYQKRLDNPETKIPTAVSWTGKLTIYSCEKYLLKHVYVVVVVIVVASRRGRRRDPKPPSQYVMLVTGPSTLREENKRRKTILF